MDKKNEKPTFEDLKQLSIGVNWDSENKIQKKNVDFTKVTKNRPKKKKAHLKSNRLDFYIKCNPIDRIFCGAFINLCSFSTIKSFFLINIYSKSDLSFKKKFELSFVK